MTNNIFVELVSSTRSFAGEYQRFRHYSNSLKCDMTFGLYLPDKVKNQKLPVLWWLSGLTCTDENFMQKAGAHKLASDLGLIIICPDTSPRGTNLAGEHDEYDFGSGAGFYVNATEFPWCEHYNMYDYITVELPQLISQHFPTNGKSSIFGHSMGGHGALVCALRHPEHYCSVSAFAPITNPINSPWGQKAFYRYLGPDQEIWKNYDACELIKNSPEKGKRFSLFIDQGEADQFLQGQLIPDALEQVCQQYNYPLTLRRHKGFDHSYFFIATFIEDHLHFHYAELQK